MKEGLISVIVPIYNVENYLDRCINSIVNQTYRNLEIILVDDGSPDRCPKICDEWAKKDDRIQVIHKKNAGLGMARNTGIDHASGEYIFFFDSDDYVALDVAEKCYASAKKYSSDVVMYGLTSVDSNGKIIHADIPNTPKDHYCGAEIQDYILPSMILTDPITGKKNHLNMSSSGRMFSMKLILACSWRFVSERDYISEDFYSLLDLYKHVRRASIIHESMYFYCCNAASLTHHYDAGRYQRICKCHVAMLQLCDRHNYSDLIKNCVDSQYVGSTIGLCKLILAQDNSQDLGKQIAQIVNDPYLQTVIRRIDLQKETMPRKILFTLIRLRAWKAVCLFVRLKMKG